MCTVEQGSQHNDFIVGDVCEVAAGIMLTLIALYILAHNASSSLATLGALIFPVIIVALLGYSLWRVRQKD